MRTSPPFSHEIITDLAALVGDFSVSVDVCIVGGGAAGFTIAQRLLGSGLKICLVESGGLAPEEDTQKLYEGRSVGQPLVLHEGRCRALGGTTQLWTGRCAPLDPIDFEARAWVAHSGWPIQSDELAPYCDQAQAACGFAAPWGADPDADAATPRFDPAFVGAFTWRYAPVSQRLYRNWSTAYLGDLLAAPNAHVLLHANATRIHANAESGRVESIEARSLNGAAATISARAFVLCCGGIENARLIMDNPLGAPGAFANRHDQLGRYFMQHPRIITGVVETDRATADKLQHWFATRPRKPGYQCERGFALPEARQRALGLLNCSAAFAYQADPASPWESAKAAGRTLARRGPAFWRHAANALTDLPGVAANLARLALGRNAIDPISRIDLVLDLEQTPDPESRITLDDDARDALGNRLPVVDWRIGDNEIRTARIFTGDLAAEFHRLGLGRIRTGAILREDFVTTHHHIGATRMAADPRDGVVDANCRVHGTENLYIGGGSMFPTGGHANPTFTIVALALRLGDHLRDVLVEDEAAVQFSGATA